MLRWVGDHLKLVALGLALLVAALVAFGLHRYFQAVDRAERADSVADSAMIEAREDSLRADSMLSVLDSVEARERRVRDSLNRALAVASEDADRAQAAVDTAQLQLTAALDTLARRVRPELEPVLARARSSLDSLTTAQSRFREAMKRRVRLLARDTASLARELKASRSAVDSLSQSYESLRDAYREMESARDRWREAARLRLFGLPPEVTHGAAAVAGVALGTLVP